MHKYAFLAFFFTSLSNSVLAEWIFVGENNRSAAYIDTAIRRTSDIATYWVLFDYKAEQVSQRSGRRYRSEKAQHQINCRQERNRTIFFTWHSDQMGNGVVIYTGENTTNWEPTSSPGSYGNVFFNYLCSK